VAHGDSAGLALPLTAPRTSFNRAVTDRREVAFCRVALAPVKRAGRQEGVTVNDVVLAMCGGALRRHLRECRELPGRSLTAAVPVEAGHRRAAPQPVGNHWAVMVVSLATDVEDLDDRIRAVAVSARAAKAVQGALGPDLWQELLDVPPAAIRVLARGYAGLRLADRHPPLVNVVVSDLRGSPAPLYCAGERVTGLYPIGPVADGLGPNITVLSYGDSLDVGIAVCPDRFGDPWLLTEALQAEGDELARRYPA
jgi:WS/DGAT/MGAT family acyltransferase